MCEVETTMNEKNVENTCAVAHIYVCTELAEFYLITLKIFPENGET